MAVNDVARADVAAIENELGLSLSAEHPLSLRCRADYDHRIGGEWFLFVEVESGQTHPQTNIIKYWPCLDEADERRVLLVQLFYDNTSVA